MLVAGRRNYDLPGDDINCDFERGETSPPNSVAANQRHETARRPLIQLDITTCVVCPSIDLPIIFPADAPPPELEGQETTTEGFDECGLHSKSPSQVSISLSLSLCISPQPCANASALTILCGLDSGVSTGRATLRENSRQMPHQLLEMLLPSKIPPLLHQILLVLTCNQSPAEDRILFVLIDFFSHALGYEVAQKHLRLQ